MSDHDSDPIPPEPVPPVVNPITEAIKSIAEGGIASSSENGRSYTNLSIKDLIEADRHLAEKEAIRKPHHGLRMTRLIPPGTG